jgi:hypothetical protein
MLSSKACHIFRLDAVIERADRFQDDWNGFMVCKESGKTVFIIFRRHSENCNGHMVLYLDFVLPCVYSMP